MGAVADLGRVDPIPRGAQMSKIVSTIVAALMLTAAASAFAGPVQDYRSPDAQAPSAAQSFVSPDARPGSTLAPAFGSTVAPVDLRSPDARPSGQFATTSQPQSSSPSNSFGWGYLALGIAMAGIVVAVVLITQRRRRHELVIGS
jgi:hypothetical protein